MMGTKHEGRKFNMLTVLGSDPDNSKKWVCRCDCGVEKSIWANGIPGGTVKSCGCHNAKAAGDRARKHGMGNRRNPTWAAWQKIKRRCFYPKVHGYENYGGRDITMHPDWVDDFQAFYDYVGPRPAPGYTLDRIDNDGNYEPGNLRWATRLEQDLNKGRKKRPDLPVGVYETAGSKRNPYRAHRMITGGRSLYLGVFPTVADAVAAIEQAGRQP